MTEPTFDQIERVRLAALRLIETRPRSRADLAERLKRKKLPTAAIEHVVQRFVEVGLVNDEALARDVVDGIQRRLPAGEVLLRAKLDASGIADDAAENAIESVERRRATAERAREAAKAVAARLKPSLSQQQRWRRVLSQLAARGFEEDTAWDATLDVLGPLDEAYHDGP